MAKYLRLLSLCLVLMSCNSDQQSVIPNVTVNLRVNLDDPNNLALNTIGSVQTFEGGVRGIIVYRKAQAEFKAFDRNCTYNPTDSCAIVELDSNLSSVVCRCCNSKFYLIDGSVNRGPANTSLKEYRTSLQGRDLYISN
jgi:nitrite reductase/ring-hydroxylating ferredoxin subunit